MTQLGQESLRRDLTVDEEEKAENTVLEFISDPDDRAVTLSSREEMAYCLRYMKRLLLDKDSKYSEEIRALKGQINELKGKLAEYLARENSAGTITYGKENETETVVPLANDFKKIKKIIGGTAGSGYRKFGPMRENSGPFIGDFPG